MRFRPVRRWIGALSGPARRRASLAPDMGASADAARVLGVAGPARVRRYDMAVRAA